MLEQLMEQRKSARRYLDTPVRRADIEEIIKSAGMAPSAINLQPWEYVIVYGNEKDRLVRSLIKVHGVRNASCGPGTKEPLPEKLIDRSRKAVKVMRPQVDKLNMDFDTFIEKGSCSFYGAPVAIIVLIDSRFPVERYLDVGLSVSYLFWLPRKKGFQPAPLDWSPRMAMK